MRKRIALFTTILTVTIGLFGFSLTAFSATKQTKQPKQTNQAVSTKQTNQAGASIQTNETVMTNAPVETNQTSPKTFWETLNIRFQGADLTLGQYELGLAPVITFSDWDFFIVKPLAMRWNPFTISFSLGLMFEYFPLRQFKLSWWIFGGEGIHPYVLAGLQTPVTFQALGIPMGLGLQGRIFEAFYLSLRFYYNLAVAPVVYPVFSWEIALEYKMLKF